MIQYQDLIVDQNKIDNFKLHIPAKWPGGPWNFTGEHFWPFSTKEQ